MKTKLKGDNRSLTKKFGNRFFVGLFNHVSAIKRFQFSILFFVFFLSSFWLFLFLCRLVFSAQGDRNDESRWLHRWHLLRRLSSSPFEGRSKPGRTATVSVLTASASGSLVFSVRRPIVSDGPHGVSFVTTDGDARWPHGVSSLLENLGTDGDKVVLCRRLL